MSLRNFNNVTTVGSLTGPLASSGVTATVSGFTNNPTAPFTVTIDRNQPTEEICLVSNITGTTLTLVRGFDGTAAQAHSAGATVEHTAGAIEYSEANTHVNATTNVHGTTGSLVADQGAQTIFSKTLVSPVLQADVSAGDAAVAYVPTAASARNLFRGVGTDGTDKITIDAAGRIVSAGTAITTLVAGATSAATGNALSLRNSTGGVSHTVVTLTNSVPVAVSDATRKDYVDTQVAAKAAIAGDLGGTAASPQVTSGAHHTHTSSQISDATSAPTPSVGIRRDAAGRAQVVDPAVAADIATKNYVDNGMSTAWVAPGSLLNSWVNYGAPYQTARYRKLRNGQVEVQGMVKLGTVGATVFTLPAGFRPAAQLGFVTLCNASTYGRVDVDASGNVIATAVTGGDNGYFAINFTFYADA